MLRALRGALPLLFWLWVLVSATRRGEHHRWVAVAFIICGVDLDDLDFVRRPYYKWMANALIAVALRKWGRHHSCACLISASWYDNDARHSSLSKLEFDVVGP